MRAYHRTTVRQSTLARGRLGDHPLWSRALGAPNLTGRLLQPVIVSARVEDRERVPEAPWLERLSITELVRDARAAASAGLAGFLLFGTSDRKDEQAMLASERDHVVTRAIHAVKDATPDLAVATDVCVCAYTPHGQCVLFKEGNADVAATHARLAEIALVHADAGADLVIPSGMIEGSVRAVREALSSARHSDVPVAAMVKLETRMYASHRAAVEAVPVSDRAVPLIAPEDAEAARTRALHDVAGGADAVVLKPGMLTLDLIPLVGASADRPILSFFTADEHALFSTNEALPDASRMEQETFVAARRAGADLLITYGALDAAEA